MASTAHQNVTRAVHRPLSKQGLLERAFAFAFRRLFTVRSGKIRRWTSIRRISHLIG